jgi:hypothetical protein
MLNRLFGCIRFRRPSSQVTPHRPPVPAVQGQAPAPMGAPPRLPEAAERQKSGQVIISSQNFNSLTINCNLDTLKPQKERALDIVKNNFHNLFSTERLITWEAADPDSSKNIIKAGEINKQHFTFTDSFWKPTLSTETQTIVMNGDTQQIKGRPLGFVNKCFGGPLDNGSGQMEGTCFTFPELLILQSMDIDLGFCGVVRGLTPFAHVKTTSGDTRSLTIDKTFTQKEIAENPGTFDLLQVVADPLLGKGRDTLASFTNLYNRYKTSFKLATTDRIILPGLAGSGLFNNNPKLCAAAAMLAAHDAGKQLDIYGMSDTEGKEIIGTINMIIESISGASSSVDSTTPANALECIFKFIV